MNEQDLLSDDALEADAQAAIFETFEFKGKALHPFSEGRRAAAQALGVKLLNGVEMPEEGMYPGALWDCHIIIWLCLSGPTQIIKSHRQPDKVMIYVQEWADENVTPADWKEELETVGRIITNTFKTKAVPVGNGLPDSPQPGKDSPLPNQEF